MTARIQNPTYSKAKPYTEITLDFSTDTIDLQITEGRFEKTEGAWRLFACLSDIDGLKDKSKFAPNGLYFLDFHFKPYESWTPENPKNPTEPTLFEELIYSALDEPEEGFNPLESFSGVISVNSNKAFLGKVKSGKLGIDNILSVANCEPLGKLQQATTSTGKGAYSRSGQTELQRLNDRLDFVIAALGLGPAEGEPKPGLQEICEKLASEGDGSLLESGHFQFDVLAKLLG